MPTDNIMSTQDKIGALLASYKIDSPMLAQELAHLCAALSAAPVVPQAGAGVPDVSDLLTLAVEHRVIPMSKVMDADLQDALSSFARALLSTPTPPPHPEQGGEEQALIDDKAVDRFAGKMKYKLARARDRGRSGWQDRAWTPEQISQALREHVEKGDPIDVANYCMFLAARGEPITPAEQPSAPVQGEVPEEWRRALYKLAFLTDRSPSDEFQAEALKEAKDLLCKPYRYATPPTVQQAEQPAQGDCFVLAEGVCGECGWRGRLIGCSMLGGVGLCCPDCRGVVEPDDPSSPPVAQDAQQGQGDDSTPEERMHDWIETLKLAHDESLDDLNKSSRSLVRGVIAEMEASRSLLATDKWMDAVKDACQDMDASFVPNDPERSMTNLILSVQYDSGNKATARVIRQIVVTTDRDGRAVSVTQQDEHHRVLETIWCFGEMGHSTVADGNVFMPHLTRLKMSLEYEGDEAPAEIEVLGSDRDMRRLEARLQYLHSLEQAARSLPTSGGEPVAWYEYAPTVDAWFLAYSKNSNAKTRPLVFGDTAPQQARQPMSEEELLTLLQRTAEGIDSFNIVTTHWKIVARAIEAHHGITATPGAGGEGV